MFKRILVTGGAGFIGSNFIHYMFEKYPDIEIYNLDKLTYAGNLENLKKFENNNRYHFFKGDILDTDILNEIFPNIDSVVHFAAETHVDRSINGPREFILTNVLGTQNLLEASRRHGNIRFHHVSTDEVYGSIPLDEDRKWTEESPYNPRSPYSASKAGADHLARAYHHTYGLPITISNCANNVGPYMYPEKFFSLAITNLIEGKKVPLYGQGLQIREWLHVEDHCSAIDKILNEGKIGETYFVGPDNDHLPNIEIIKKIIGEMGKDISMIEFVNDRPGHDAKYSLDISKIKNNLGWKPTNNLDETIKKTVDWYVKNEDWWKKIKSSEEYQNYYNKQYSK